MNDLSSTVDLLQLLGEPTRVRLASLLERHELTVAELTAITQVPQSSLSAHLGRMKEAGLLRDRKAGTSCFYSLKDGAMPAPAREVWSLVRDKTKDPLLEADRTRCEGVLRARAKDEPWPDAIAGEMDRHYSPGRTWESLARGLVGLFDLGDVVDIGSGDGAVAQLLAPRAKRVACVDKSPRMIAAAKTRLAKAKNVTCEVGDAESLPFKAGSFDAALLFNVLASVEKPERALAEAARVLKKGGSIAVVTLSRHAHAQVASEYGHVHQGFAPAALKRMMSAAGFTVGVCDVTSREKRAPYFEVVTASGRKS